MKHEKKTNNLTGPGQYGEFTRQDIKAKSLRGVEGIMWIARGVVSPLPGVTKNGNSLSSAGNGECNKERTRLSQ